jgi:hypothetical protein
VTTNSTWRVNKNNNCHPIRKEEDAESRASDLDFLWHVMVEVFLSSCCCDNAGMVICARCR